jgi:peptide/nickel transport system permease protein
MQAFIIRRLMQTLVVLFIVSLGVFALIYLIPGDPVLVMLGPDARKEAIFALRAQLGLDKPMIVQFGNWLFKVLRGDFGQSIIYHENVADLIAARLPVTFYLGITAFTLTVLIGTTAGILCVVRRGTLLDQIITVCTNLGISTPVFWLGILGIYVIGLKLEWLPVQGFTSPFDDFWLSVQQAIMPSLCLAVVPLAVITRQSRSAMLEVIQQDYIRTAWSKGLNERTVLLRHALKNALVPIVTLLGMQVRYVVGGSVLLETVFNIPGMGRLIVNAVFDKDFILVQACVLVMAVVISLSNLAVDISYAYIDPRIRHE